MSNELRAVADRLRKVYKIKTSSVGLAEGHLELCQIYYGPNVDSDSITPYEREACIRDDERIICNAHLAAHPADDEEPVTEEWLRSVGFTQAAPYVLHSPWSRESALVEWFPPDPDDPVQTEGFRVGNYWARRVKTRSDVRRLCVALGIELGGGE